MINRTNFRTAIKVMPCWAVRALLFSLCGLLVVAVPAPQEEDDGARRLWNKQFEAARVRARKPTPTATSQATETKQQAAVDGELIGITVWRLRTPVQGDDQSTARLLVQKSDAAPSQYLLERVEADTPFSEGQRVRISIETPREGINYLYVIDREVYADGKLGEPSLIFPARTTPPGGNVAVAGKIISVPAQGDPIPYFTLQRSSKSQVSEKLTVIISSEPLPLNIDQPIVDLAQLTRWEKQWGGPTQRRELRSSTGQQWTKVEQQVEQGERKLVQGDPLPQTIYRVKTKPGGRLLVNLPLLIAP